jgi:hypothetical protein
VGKRESYKPEHVIGKRGVGFQASSILIASSGFKSFVSLASKIDAAFRFRADGSTDTR